MPKRIVAGHIRCVQCNYDLYGAASCGTCPECGLWVAASLVSRVRPFTAVMQREAIASIDQMIRVLAAVAVVCAALVLVSLLVRSPWLGIAGFVSFAILSLVAGKAAARLWVNPRWLLMVFPLLSIVYLLRGGLILISGPAKFASGLSLSIMCGVAVACGAVLRALAPIAGMACGRYLQDTMAKAMVAYGAIVTSAAILYFTDRPTKYSAHGMPFIAELLILGTTFLLLSAFKRRLRALAPMEDGDVSVD